MKPGNANVGNAGRHDRSQHELKPGKGGQIARSAGAYGQLVGRDQGMAILRLNSGEQRIVHGSCFATAFRRQPNPEHANIKDGKAGCTRWRGKRPHNRGVTMNPVDHRTAVVRDARRVAVIL